MLLFTWLLTGRRAVALLLLLLDDGIALLLLKAAHALCGEVLLRQHARHVGPTRYEGRGHEGRWAPEVEGMSER